MPLSDKTRKILWGRSGNRCAICRRELVMDATNLDDEAVVGDECHIVAREPNGPRGDSPLPLEQRDEYPNLILLCKVHHKLIDDQPNTYSVDGLQKIKHQHEMWVRESLKVKPSTSQTPTPFVAYRIETGKQLLSTLGGSHAWLFDKDNLETESETELVGDFFQNAQDYLELWDALESQEQIRAQFKLDQDIKELERNGFLLYGCQRVGKYQFGNIVENGWRTAYLLLRRKSNPVVAKKDSETLEKLGIVEQPDNEFSSFILLVHQ